jgi:hypothetical protein
LFRPVYGRGKGQAQMISGWSGSALEPGRTRLQHLDLDTGSSGSRHVLTALPEGLLEAAVPGVPWSAMHAGSEIARR